MEILNQYLSGVAVPIALVVFSIYFIIKLKGKPLNSPRSIIKGILNGGNSKRESIRSVTLALAGTLGVGNIVGVASAIALGGAGSLFWMWISALLAMILKYSEVVLAMLHKKMRGVQSYGGAMYYMRDCFASRNKKGIGFLFTLIFTCFCLVNGFTMGCAIQSNSIAQAFISITDISPTAIGVLVAVLALTVFMFNGRRIFSICEALVPFVSILYIGMCVFVIAPSLNKIPSIISMILKDAFTLNSAGGGALGFFVSRALRYGTIRGLFSNESGCGTSTIAHATSNAKSSVEQGFLGIIEVFIDTVVVCSLTGFVILINYEEVMKYSSNPIMMVIRSFEMTLGAASKPLFFISVFLFALATIICWGYYGRECIWFLSKSKCIERIYYLIYVLFAFVGSIASMDVFWAAADLAVGVMTIMNLMTLSLMSKEIKRETLGYYKKEPL